MERRRESTVEGRESLHHRCRKEREKGEGGCESKYAGPVVRGSGGSNVDVSIPYIGALWVSIDSGRGVLEQVV